MTGKELNNILIANEINFNELATKLEFLKSQLLFIDNEIKVYPETETNLKAKIKEML